MGEVIKLNNGVTIADLYKNLDKDKIKLIEKASSGGFTVKELESLEEEGIDTSLIKKNSTSLNGDTAMNADKNKSTKNDADVTTRAEEVKNKYCKNLEAFSGDPFSMDNPELKALSEAMNDGLIADLKEEGFDKYQIISIIEKSFPTVGINAIDKSGAYNRPYGHGTEAKELYARFSSQLVNATGEDTEEIKEAKAKLASINSQIESNNHQLQVLDVTVDALQQEVEEQIDKAIEDSKDIQDEQKEKSKELVNKHLNEYKNSKGEMTYAEFQKGLKGDLTGLQTKSGRELSEVIGDIVDANHKMGLLKSYVEDMGNLMDENAALTEDAADLKTDIEEMVKENIENSKDCEDPDANCTDPIGFSDEATRYDFFVDKDDNKDITNETEFLGAERGFAEMKDLDTDGDNIVSAKELEEANVKVIKTNKDGTQEIIDASNIFKNATDGIDLSSYSQTHKDLGNGNTLMGTFSASMNGQKMDGYQTLDTNEWLDQNYNFTDEDEGKGRFAKDIQEVAEGLDLSDKVNIFTLKNEELEEKITTAFDAYGISEDMVAEINAATESSAEVSGKKIEQKFKDIALKKEDKEVEWTEEDEEAALKAAGKDPADKADETKEADNDKDVDETDKDKDKEDEKDEE